MAISFIGQATGVDTATMPTHAAGDLILVQAYRGSTALAPTLPSGFTSISSVAANSNAVTVGYKVAASSSETVGTWTNAEITIVHVYRGVNASPIGGSAVFTNIATFIYPAVTMAVTDGSSWVAAFAGTKSAVTGIETPPTGMVNRSDEFSGSSYESAGHDTNGGVTSWSQIDTGVSTGGNRFRSIAIEIKAGASSGSPYTLPVSTTAVTVTGSNAAAKADRRAPVTTSAVSLAGSSVTLTYTPATTPKTLAVTSAPVILAGSTVTTRLARKLVSSTAAVTVTGSAVTLTYAPASGAKVLPVSFGQITLNGSEVVALYSGFVRRGGDDVPRRRHIKLPKRTTIRDILEEEAEKDRPKTQKVKREVAKKLLDVSGLLTERVPQPLYRKIDKALEVAERKPENPAIYKAIEEVLIRLKEEEDEEDEAMAILMAI